MTGGGGGGLLNATSPSSAILKKLESDASSYTWAAATVGANNAAGYQLASGLSVMPIGGFNGSDPSPTLAQFKAWVDAGRIDVDVPADELAARLERLGPVAPRYRRGYGAMYLDHVLQANEGCDFDFLRARPDDPEETEPYGLLSGWVGGW